MTIYYFRLLYKQKNNKMNKFEALGLPKNFKDLLPELQTKTIQWEANCYSGTEINNKATISYYASLRAPYGNIVLCPGLGTNTQIDPLSNMIIFWALTHRFNVITLNTFLGQFYTKPTPEQAQRNTYPEFITLLQNCIQYIAKYCIGTNIMIGHSAGATGVINAMNNITSTGQTTNINSVMLFAPWASIKWHSYLKKIICTKLQTKTPPFLPITNIFDTQLNGKMRFVPISPDFLKNMDQTPFNPDLMNNWGSYITIIAGEKDRKTSTTLLTKRFEVLKQQPNKDKFSFIVLPGAKHSFLEIYKNNQSVISLIKSQKDKLHRT